MLEFSKTCVFETVDIEVRFVPFSSIGSEIVLTQILVFDLVGAELNQTQSTDWVRLSSIDYVAHLLISCIKNLDPKSLDKMEQNQGRVVQSPIKVTQG